MTIKRLTPLPCPFCGSDEFVQSYMNGWHLWWVACVKESELRKGLIYWKVVLSQNPLTGYADTKNSAIKIVEAIVKTEKKYNYHVINAAQTNYKKVELEYINETGSIPVM